MKRLLHSSRFVLSVMTIVVVTASWFIAENAVKRVCDSIFETAARDIHKTINACIGSYLAFTANVIIDEVGTVKPLSIGQMNELAARYGLDEISFIDTNGVWVASSVTGVVNRLTVADSPVFAAYRTLLEDTTDSRKSVCESFRESVCSPTHRFKYLATMFDDRSGLIQIGYDEQRLSPDIDSDFPGIEDIFSYSATGRVRMLCHLPIAAEWGIPENTTYTAMVDSELCHCRYLRFAEHYFVIILPDSDYFQVRLMIIGIPTLVMLLVLLILFTLTRYNQRIRAAEDSLKALEESRQQRELELASSIQHHAMPDIFPAFPDDFTFDLYARADSARNVGGDFYDFFRLRGGRLAVVIADVSGKGVPAAMFMMHAKSVIKSCLPRCGDLSDAAELINQELCAGNSAHMFVTAWIGVLDTATGALSYVNAGHNPPYIRAADGSLRALDSVSGLVFGGMSGMRYRTFSDRLNPGEMLFLFTDGVTEAHNPLGTMFGERELEAVLRGERGAGLAKLRPGGAEKAIGATEMVTRVHNAVTAFAGSAQQFDDITMLAVVYRGASAEASMTVPATLEAVAQLTDFAAGVLNRHGFTGKVRNSVMIAFDEIASNIARYSGSGEMSVTIETAELPKAVRVTFRDRGQAWNPLDHSDPDVTLPAEERPIGGLGILMVKKLVDGVTYERVGDTNTFSFRKQDLPGGAV